MQKGFVAILALLVWTGMTQAEEGGSGHYFPGSMSSFVDGVPGEPGFILRAQFIHYAGSVGLGRTIPVAGQLIGNAQAESFAIGLTAAWAPSWNLGEKWSYAMTERLATSCLFRWCCVTRSART